MTRRRLPAYLPPDRIRQLEAEFSVAEKAAEKMGKELSAAAGIELVFAVGSSPCVINVATVETAIHCARIEIMEGYRMKDYSGTVYRDNRSPDPATDDTHRTDFDLITRRQDAEGMDYYFRDLLLPPDIITFFTENGVSRLREDYRLGLTNEVVKELTEKNLIWIGGRSGMWDKNPVNIDRQRGHEETYFWLIDPVVRDFMPKPVLEKFQPDNVPVTKSGRQPLPE
ncbi:MAG: hypothetical protein M3O22_07270 [Pseudomonadota bacterium]|nr:hypothetical protein [Pseudomonadota bacterium]